MRRVLPLLLLCAFAPALRASENQALILEAVQNRADLTSMRSKGTFRIIDEREDYELAVNVEVLAAEPQSLKVRATRMAKKGFTILMRGGKLQFYLPREGKLYVGTPRRFAEMTGFFSPERLMDRLLRFEPSMAARAWARDDLTGDTLVFTEVHPEGHPYLRLTIDGVRRRIERVAHYDATGRAYFVESYSRYVTVDTPRGEREFPLSAELEWPQLKRRALIDFRGVEPDREITEEMWRVRISHPGETKTLPLSELGRGSPPEAKAEPGAEAVPQGDAPVIESEP